MVNLTPHSALSIGTPYKALFGKEVDVLCLKTIDARAFVRIETHTKKLDDKAWEGKLCGYSQDTRAYRVYNPATHKGVERRNVIIMETPSQRVPPPAATTINTRGNDPSGVATRS